MTDAAKGKSIAGVSAFVLTMAAAGGLGLGIGSSVAAGRAATVETAGGIGARQRAEQARPLQDSQGRPLQDTQGRPLQDERARPLPDERAAQRVAKAPEAPTTTTVIDVAKAEDAAIAPPEVVAEPEVVAPEVVPEVPLGPVDAQALEAALDDVFKKRKSDRQLGKEFYATHGVGRFAGANGPTALGSAVVARTKTLAEHAIDATPYDMALIEAAADNGTPADGVARDVRLFGTFLDLVMDFRFLHKAGPFKLLDRGDVYEREKKELKDFIAQVMSAPDANAAIALLDPPHPLYGRMKEVLAEYRALAAAVPECPKLSAGWRFRAGSKGEEVKKLQQRLACEGYFQGEVDGRFEGATVEAVKAYQEHHDLPVEGNVLEETMKSLNVPLERRVKQIGLALQRMREGRFDRMGDVFIRVNIPSFLLRFFEHGQVIREQKVIVGTNKLDDDKVQLIQGHINRTKLFGTRLYEVIVNPTWILPKRVEEGELATSLDKDADYLGKSNIKKVKLGSGTEVFVQGAGKGNVLGKVKFLLEETNAIYLHDTDKRQLFKKQRRDFSHGCMRVDQAIDFGKWLLLRDGFTEAEVEKAFAAANLQRGFDLKQPVNLVTEYITVDLAPDGKPVFYDDIYGYDLAYFSDKLPPQPTTRWGSKVLRPRWVPVMDEETVDGWRKAGKAAPRDLGPDGKPKPVATPDSDIDEGP